MDKHLSVNFERIALLPPYVFNIINELKQQARANGKDVIDFGMGNPDQPTPNHIVEKLIETAKRGETHRYSQSRGIFYLRQAICNWYKRRYDVTLDPDKEAIYTIGSKEGIAHLAMAILNSGDNVLVPNPAYPIHPYGCAMAGANLIHVPIGKNIDFIEELQKAIVNAEVKPKILIINFPSNPTAQCVDLDFFKQIIDIAKENGIWIIHDLAYADIAFDGYKSPSIMQIPGAKDVAVEFFTLSKSYNMPGWRVGFMVGNSLLVNALAKIKSYLDYGTFTPIQIAAITALEDDQTCVQEIASMYQKRRDVLCEGLASIGWSVEIPKATMFVWAEIPAKYQHMKSLAFAKKMISEANIAVAPGIGFGEYGDNYVRFGLIENAQRTHQAIRNLRRMFKKDGLL